jgi:hypothetical protein
MPKLKLTTGQLLKAAAITYLHVLKSEGFTLDQEIDAQEHLLDCERAHFGEKTYIDKIVPRAEAYVQNGVGRKTSKK